MQFHIIRENESLEDVCKLYSVSLNKIKSVNKLKEGNYEGKKILIPINNFYYFKNKEESVKSVGSKFNIEEDTLYKYNKRPLCFRDGTIRLYIKKKNNKDIEIQGIVDIKKADNTFAEVDLHSSYLSKVYGYNGISYIEEKDCYEMKDYYLSQAKIINNIETSLIINNIGANNYNEFYEKINQMLLRDYKDITLYYDLNNIDLEDFFSTLKDKNIDFNVLLDYNLLKSIIKKEESISIINNYAKNIIVLPSYIEDSNEITYSFYKNFLEEIKVFDLSKIIVGYNVNDENKKFQDDIDKIKLLYDNNISKIVIYNLNKRDFSIKYMISDFYNINKF